MTYPNSSKIATIFAGLASGDGPGFFSHVLDNVDWDIKGHSPMSRKYTNKQDFIDSTIKYLNDHVLAEKLKMKVVNVIGCDENGQAVVEMEADTTCRDGTKYDMRYCWVCQFNEEGKISKVRAYIDTELLTRAIERNTPTQ